MTETQWQWAWSQAKSEIARHLVEGLLNIEEATGGDESAQWEQFQIDYLNMAREEERIAVAVSKTRQCGFSWLLAAEAVGRAARYPGSLTNIVSINKDEAEEKIRYARIINDCMQPGARIPRWLTDNRGELEADNGSRIRSHACTPPRGRPGANHRLDECAHYQRPIEIYQAAVPGIARKGSITACSSPWVKGGWHYQVMEEPNLYPDFVRIWVPWWEVFGLCNDVEAAKQFAPNWSTQARVEQFGTDRLQFLYRNMPLDAFQVECELAYADDSLAWITWEEIQQCTADETMDFVIAEGLDDVRAAIAGLYGREREGRVFAGYDLARKHDKAVLALLEEVGGRFTCFAVLILPNVEFTDQKAMLEGVTPLITSGCIDATGMGANLAEDMHRYNRKWHEIVFSNPVKAELAVDLRQQFQDKSILIPPDRDLQRDIHSVRRIVSAANNIIYDADRDDDLGHADRFWALALGVNAVVRQWHTAAVKPGDVVVSGAKRMTAQRAGAGDEHEIEVRPLTSGQIERLGPQRPIGHEQDEPPKPGTGTGPIGPAMTPVQQHQLETAYPHLRAKRLQREMREREARGEPEPEEAAPEYITQANGIRVKKVRAPRA